MSTKVRDVMTTDVVTVDEGASFRELAGTLVEHRIAALPVVDDAGAVVGIVSEADLLPNQGRVDIDRPLFQRRQQRRARRKAEGRSAGEVMTAPAITIHAGATVAQAARLMHGGKVKHLPVVDDAGKLAGIVSRGDLARVFLRADAEILAEVAQAVRDQRLDGDDVQVQVHDGVVTLSGGLERRSHIAPLLRLTRELDGVVAVDGHELVWQVDDLSASSLPTM